MSDQMYNYTVVIIEDEKFLRESMQQYLERYFSNVYIASNAEDGYQLYKKNQADILFIDINLPNMNGIELLQKIRKDDQALRAIMITARDDLETLLKATELKLTKYIVKPVSRKELREVVTLVVEELQNFTVLSHKVIKLSNEYIWYKDKEELHHLNEQIHLTKLETSLLSLLIENINNVLSYDFIIEELWGFTEEDKKAPLKTLIKNLRLKVPKNLIKNEFGEGYKITDRI